MALTISNRLTSILAGILLSTMFIMAVFSMKGDSATMDELAHLPAGYSYLTQKDMRLNPEHPPLVKDLAALPLLFIQGINLPAEIPAWQKDVNGQWEFGHYFLYLAGNPADKMIFWARIPMVLILIMLGFYIFRWTKELLGNKAALLALFLFSFSPTFLAHGRLVTTDVGAAAGVFISTYYFIKALKKPTKKNILLGAILFGIAQLFKFSVILLAPLFVFLALAFWLAKMGSLRQAAKVLILVFIIGYLLVGLVYQYHVWNYPTQKQAEDAKVYLSSYPPLIKNPIVWISQKPILRPYAQYLTGLLMVFNRAAFGHTTYFLGEVSDTGWKYYFPIVYLIKETVTFHVLSLMALFYMAWLLCLRRGARQVKNWLKDHFSEFAMVSFILLYWAISLKSNLNIGVRHLLPTFPFVMVLASTMTIRLLKAPHLRLKYLLLFVLIFWQIFSVIKIYPHFLSYFNEMVGGPDKGYVYTVDSNLDWGQDLKRLTNWVEENNIQKIKVAYFGGGDPIYYLGDKAEYFNWQEPQKGFLAVSATLLQVGKVTGQFSWLKPYPPIAKIGYSIFIYQID